MNLWIIFGAIFIFYSESIEGQTSCSGNADSCLQQAGITPGVGNNVLFCSETPKKLDEAGSCIQNCGYGVPSLFQETVNNLASTCSDCQDFKQQYEVFRLCYNSTIDLKRLISIVISKYNARALQMEDCLNLRSQRSCMNRASQSCPYLSKIFIDLSQNLEKFDVALHICGAENVNSKSRDEGCDSAKNNVEANCNIACELSGATNAGDICSLLQKQSDCINGYSKDCTETRVTELLPRLSSYSLINQIFRCNISFDGVVVLPTFGLECEYKDILDKCFDIGVSTGIPILDIKKLLNGDLNTEPICSNYNNKDDKIMDCTRSLWPCSIPLAQIYARKPSLSEFNNRLGTFPLSDLGLQLLFGTCQSGQPKSGHSCPAPDYNAIRTTPARTQRYTQNPRLQTPAGLGKKA